MSVPVSQRSEAGNEFLYLTREIQVAAVQFCANQVPKKYHYLIANKIADAADQAHKHVKIANRYNPTKDAEYQIRRNHLLTALGYLDTLVTDIEIVPELVGINPDKIERLSGLISREQALLGGVLQSDTRRHSKAAHK